MTHDELLVKIGKLKADAAGDVWLIHNDRCCGNCTCKEVEKEVTSIHNALCAIVELHKPEHWAKWDVDFCLGCKDEYYPCLTIQAIEAVLND